MTTENIPVYTRKLIKRIHGIIYYFSVNNDLVYRYEKM